MAGSVQLANGAQCICGNKNALRFRQYRDHDNGDEHLGSFCLECKTEYLKESLILDDAEKDKAKLNLGKEEFYQAERLDTTDSGVHDVHPRKTAIENLDLFADYLKPGYHIAWHRPYIIWHHALVLDIDVAKGKILVIHWNSEGISDARIQEELMDLKQQYGILYRMDYEEDILKENPLQLVIARARSRLGDVGYQFFGDNCEAFVTYCKKGIQKSQQVVALKKKLSDLVITALDGCLSGKLTSKGLGIAIASFFKTSTAEGMEKIANNCRWVGFGLVIIIEGGLTIYDLKKLYDARKDGSLSREDFMEQASKRVTEAICTAVPAAIGGLVPGVPGVFVGTVCGTVGKIVGAWIGPYVGRAITNLIRKNDTEAICTAVPAAIGGLVPGVLGVFVGTVCGAVGKIVGAWIGPYVGRAVTRNLIRPNDKAVDDIKDLHLGDQIVFYGTLVHPRHHCIVLWHEEEEKKVNVIHNTYEFGVIQEWIKFVPPFYKVRYEEKECRPPEEVCERATSKLGTKDYNLLTYNCKHFAEWCKKR